MPRVLVTPSMLQGDDGPYLTVLEEAGFDVVYPPEPLMEEGLLARHLQGIDAVIAGMEPFTDVVLRAAGLRVIARMGVGYDAIDIPAATREGVAITITPGTNEVSVAEQTIALLMAVMRRVVIHDHQVRSGRWDRGGVPRLAGKTIGLIGLGRIGRAVVPRARGLGLTVLATDPVADIEFAAAHDVTLVDLDELLMTSDIVSLHLPASVETEDLICAQTLAIMKPGAVLINTSRGTLVDEQALVAALTSGRLFGAGLDVFKEEPLPISSPLIELHSVVLAPHVAGLDQQSAIDMSRLAAACIVDLHQGRWPEGCVVNDSLRGGWKW